MVAFPPVYLLDQFPRLRHLQGSTSTVVFESGCRILTHAGLDFPFHWAFHSTGLSIPLGFPFHWAFHSTGLPLPLGFPSTGLPIPLVFPFHWVSHSTGLPIPLGFLFHWAFHSTFYFCCSKPVWKPARICQRTTPNFKHWITRSFLQPAPSLVTS